MQARTICLHPIIWWRNIEGTLPPSLSFVFATLLLQQLLHLDGRFPRHPAAAISPCFMEVSHVIVGENAVRIDVLS